MINWRQLIEALAEVGKVDAALGLFESLEPRFRIIPNITLFFSVWKLCKDYHRTDKTLGYMDYFFRYLCVCAVVRVRWWCVCGGG